MRQGYINLNGLWQFEIDNSCSGEDRGLQTPGRMLSRSIMVPFCPECKLSGIEHRDFMNGVWYKRTVEIGPRTGRVRLHFGAVDYRCKVFVNGVPAGEHTGSYSSFFFDITELLHSGENELALFARDDSRDPMIPSGKQSIKYPSYRCFYTRTTGIWQTVWLELLPENHIEWVRYYPNVTDGSVTVQVQLQGKGNFDCDITYEGRQMAQYRSEEATGYRSFTLPLQESHLWEVGKGRLYDVQLSFGEDLVSSYFGLREIRMDGYRFLLNGKSVFQRLILDQGFYPDGIYTAPTEADLVRDIELSMALGFNGARLHEKVFEERFLYHADKMGCLVWGEYPDWGTDVGRPELTCAILPEWLEVFRQHYAGLEKDGVIFDQHAQRQTYPGGPVFVSEYGGIRWAEGENDENRIKSWGYGKDVAGLEAFYTRYQGLTDVLLDNPKMLGLCYTQLTDVE